MKTYNVYFEQSHRIRNDIFVVVGVQAGNKKEACEQVRKTVGFYPFHLYAFNPEITQKERNNIHMLGYEAWEKRSITVIDSASGKKIIRTASEFFGIEGR